MSGVATVPGSQPGLRSLAVVQWSGGNFVNIIATSLRYHKLIRAAESQILTKIDDCRFIMSGVATVLGSQPGLRNLAVVQISGGKFVKCIATSLRFYKQIRAAMSQILTKMDDCRFIMSGVATDQVDALALINHCEYCGDRPSQYLVIS